MTTTTFPTPKSIPERNIQPQERTRQIPSYRCQRPVKKPGLNSFAKGQRVSAYLMSGEILIQGKNRKGRGLCRYLLWRVVIRADTDTHKEPKDPPYCYLSLFTITYILIWMLAQGRANIKRLLIINSKSEVFKKIIFIFLAYY